MVTFVSMILPSDYIGTDLGLASNDIGTTVPDNFVGVVQDHTEKNQAYT